MCFKSSLRTHYYNGEKNPNNKPVFNPLPCLHLAFWYVGCFSLLWITFDGFSWKHPTFVLFISLTWTTTIWQPCELLKANNPRPTIMWNIISVPFVNDHQSTTGYFFEDRSYTSTNIIRNKLSGFWNLSIDYHSKITQRFGNWICFRLQVKWWGGTYSVVSVRKIFRSQSLRPATD
jgi:hypothetical protein